MIYALLGMCLFAVPAIIGIGAWIISSKDLKSLRTQRAEILSRMGEDNAEEPEANSVASITPAFAEKEMALEVERQQFLKSGRKLHPAPQPFTIIELGDDEILHSGDDGREYADFAARLDDEAEDSGFAQLSIDYGDKSSRLLLVESTSKRAGSSAKTAKAILLRSAKSGRVVARSAITGKILSQGGIKSKGRKKSIILSHSADDEKSAG